MVVVSAGSLDMPSTLIEGALLTTMASLWVSMSTESPASLSTVIGRITPPTKIMSRSSTTLILGSGSLISIVVHHVTEGGRGFEDYSWAVGFNWAVVGEEGSKASDSDFLPFL